VSPNPVPESVADRPEQLQLLDPYLLNLDPSQCATPARPSRSETLPPLSQIGTGGQEVPNSPGLLQAITDAATLVAASQGRLDVAIEAARVAGCSWREIGAAAGVAYQSLHRRHRQRPAT
jgi:hypothetical protein